jgi:hypothetical protein
MLKLDANYKDNSNLKRGNNIKDVDVANCNWGGLWVPVDGGYVLG